MFKIFLSLKNNFFILPVLLIAFLAATPPQKTEKTPIDFSAENMFSARHISHDAFRLVDNVKFVHEGSIMHCDSAIIFRDQNKLEAFSRIFIIVNDTVTISGKHLKYDGNTRIAELEGNVTLVDPKMTLTTSGLIYDLRNNTANYSTGGKIVDAENTLTSQWGFYYVDDRKFLFQGDVWLVNPDYDMCSDTLKYNTETEVAFFFGPTTIVGTENTIFCKNGWYDTRNDLASFSQEAKLQNEEQSLTGDSLFYDRNLGFGKAMKNVIMIDTVQNTIVTGHYAEHYEKEKISIVTDEALLKYINKEDTLFMHADTLRLVFPDQTENRAVFAYFNAKMYRDDFQAMADSIIYSFSDSIFYLYKSPVVWSDNNQLTAKHIEIHTSDENIKEARLIDAAFVVSQEDDIGFNQVKGKDIVGHFENGQMTKIVVTGNGETIYFVLEEIEEGQEEAKGDLVGINKAMAQRLTIYAEDNKVTGIMFYEKPDATLYPPEELPENQRKLLNFQWLDGYRPKKMEDIFIKEEMKILDLEDPPTEAGRKSEDKTSNEEPDVNIRGLQAQ